MPYPQRKRARYRVRRFQGPALAIWLFCVFAGAIVLVLSLMTFYNFNTKEPLPRTFNAAPRHDDTLNSPIVTRTDPGVLPFVPTTAPPRSHTADNALFTQSLTDPLKVPGARILNIPLIDNAFAIWGSLGHDDKGHIYFGVSMHSSGSARLYEYRPETDEIVPHGDVVSALDNTGVRTAQDFGISQMKIHSRIVQANDGHMYFTSMDEEGEDDATQTLPKWGSHLWRLTLPGCEWEHVARADEALIALGTGDGEHLWALGYYGHVLYCYSLLDKTWRRVVVGSVGAHTSRNIVTDSRGHVYVPRVEPGLLTGDPPRVWLVEFDPQLNKLAQTPLEHYLGSGTPEQSHGIVAFQPLADKTVVFATHEGYLYHVIPPPDGETLTAAKVEPIGFYRGDKNSAYVPTMFTDAGTNTLFGLQADGEKREKISDWIAYDLPTRTPTITHIDLTDIKGNPIQRPLLYGSIVRDNEGNFYVGGCDLATRKGSPVLIKLPPPGR
ncbi:MAG: hypothetical protein GC164_04110 [Phycisphaera sp.]|nr:hypothetical protein [Phycisphaera sp.]